MTPTQQTYISFIREFISKNGYPPTRREIMDGLGKASPNAVFKMLIRLEDLGYIEVDKNKSRAIRIK